MGLPERAGAGAGGVSLPDSSDLAGRGGHWLASTDGLLSSGVNWREPADWHWLERADAN